MDVREFKERVFQAGAAAGLEDMEIYVVRSKDLSIRVFQKEVDDYTISVGQGVGFRARFAGKIGYAYAETLAADSIQLLVEGVRANAEVIDSDDEIVLFAGADSYPEVHAYNEELAEVTPKTKIEFAKDLEKEAFAADERVSMVNWAAMGYREGETYIANTLGLEQSFSQNGAYGLVSAVVREDEQVKTGSRMRFSNDWSKFNAHQLADDAVAEAVSLLNAETVKSGEYRVLLRYDVVRTFLSTFASVFSAEAVQKGLSLLAGRLGGANSRSPPCNAC